VKPLPRRFVEYIEAHNLLKPGHRVGIAVSGGLDSVALLRLTLELKIDLGIVLSVVHFNHHLRGSDSNADQEFVEALARQFGLDFHGHEGEVKVHSAAQHLSIEAAARELRYNFFQNLLESGKLDRVATAHTLDDQAETVLLRLARGAGTQGLAGIYPFLAVSSGAIIRPLLATRRHDLEAYINSLQQTWREDRTNLDLSHTRNRVRHNVLPLLERELNPGIRDLLSETANIARDEEQFWKETVTRTLPQVSASAESLRLDVLLAVPVALQRRVVRYLAESLGLKLEARHVNEVLLVAAGKAAAHDLSDEWCVKRELNELAFCRKQPEVARDYEYALAVPGSAEVPEANSRFEVLLSTPDPAVSKAVDWLDPTLLQEDLKVRNWRPGDRFWPAHSKEPRKIKELLQERKVSNLERKMWPVVVSGNEIIWLRGFTAPSRFRIQAGTRSALAIVEHPRG
jgi:tRNA(Ile)-lysidine synthase